MPPPPGAPQSPPAADGRKKPAVATWRVWSEADEVRILEGLAAYAAAHGAEPRRSQLRAALDGCGLDKSEFTVTEIYEKVRRLRIKYANLRSAGGVPVPAGGDEARKYELSMSIWGDRPLNVPKKVGASRATSASASAPPRPAAGIARRRRRQGPGGATAARSLGDHEMTIEECPHYAAAIPRANRGGETGRLPPTSAVVPPVPTATAGGKKQLKKKARRPREDQIQT